MKKLIIAIGLAVSVLSANAETKTLTILPASFTNLLSVVGSAKVTQIAVASTTGSNTTVVLIDTPTNALTYVQSAYTNTLSYGTNYTQIYTNYFGVLTTNLMTNVLTSVSRTVAASTNAYPVRATVSALASTTATAYGVNYYFGQGIWATNTSTGTAAVTITYQQ